MIKAQYIAIATTGKHYSIYAANPEEAVQVFRCNNIHGKCKQLGTDLWREI